VPERKQPDDENNKNSQWSENDTVHLDAHSSMEATCTSLRVAVFSTTNGLRFRLVLADPVRSMIRSLQWCLWVPHFAVTWSTDYSGCASGWVSIPHYLGTRGRFAHSGPPRSPGRSGK